jgi:hypothetical protein
VVVVAGLVSGFALYVLLVGLGVLTVTACVFYAVLSHRDPTWSRFTAGIEPAEAQYLQYNAANVVARNLAMDFGTSGP